jgi:tripartite tricarboxylate transporter family receptor
MRCRRGLCLPDAFRCAPSSAWQVSALRDGFAAGGYALWLGAPHAEQSGPPFDHGGRDGRNHGGRNDVDALTDPLGGQVQVAFTDPASLIGYIRAGKVRALAITTATRSETLPETPSIGEFVPGYHWDIIRLVRFVYRCGWTDNDLATPRRCSMKSCVTGLSVRFFSVRIAIGHGFIRKSIGNDFSDHCVAV